MQGSRGNKRAIWKFLGQIVRASALLKKYKKYYIIYIEKKKGEFYGT
jgi:hypothetical protein